MTHPDNVPENMLGVEYDEAIEKAVAAESAEDMLNLMAVNLDWMADSNDVPLDKVAEIRELQEDVRELRDDFEMLGVQHRTRAEQLKARLDD